MMYDIVRVLLIWILCFLSVLLHELGHALGYRISGRKTEWRIRAGSGPEILNTAKFSFCLLPAGGYFDPRELYYLLCFFWLSTFAFSIVKRLEYR